MAQKNGLGIISWSPMAMGILAGRYAAAKDVPATSRAKLRGGIYAQRVTRRGVEVGEQFGAIARQYGISPIAIGSPVGKGPGRHQCTFDRAEDQRTVAAPDSCR